MAKFPPSLQRLIDLFSELPTIGPKTAERFIFFLLRQREYTGRLIQALTDLHQNVTQCERCHTYSEKNPCYICSNPDRDQTLLCVVAETNDLAALESTGRYRGLYHVLGGTLNAAHDSVPPYYEHLLQRLHQPGVREVILAFNPDIDGESTILALSQALKDAGPRLSRLARGLPMGGDVSYADDITLGNALDGRREM